MKSYHFLDNNEIPAGGQTFGRGFSIAWQNGPIVVDGTKAEPNGAFVRKLLKPLLIDYNFFKIVSLIVKKTQKL